MATNDEPKACWGNKPHEFERVPEPQYVEQHHMIPTPPRVRKVTEIKLFCRKCALPWTVKYE